jgi:hypothetical protein
MTGLNSPDKDDWMVIIETTDDGCTVPTGKDGQADLNAEDDDSCGSTRSSDSSPDEATEDSDPAAGAEKYVLSFKARFIDELTVTSKAARSTVVI